MSTLRALRSYTHLLIAPQSWLVLNQSFSATASNHFYDLPVLTSIVHSLLPLLGKTLVLLLSFWMAPSPPGLHSLIDCRRLWWSSGSGLVFSIYNAPCASKEASVKHRQPFLSHPPKKKNICMILHQHSQEIKLTHQRKGQAAHKVSLQGLSFFIIMIMCQHCAPCPRSFWDKPI